MVEEVIYQEHTYEITKEPNVGFGIAISGGRDNPGVQSGDPAIIISDVVRHGPAFGKLEINDTVVRVNNKITYGMTHQQAVRELKNSGKRVLISVKRKAVVRVESRRTPSPGAMRRSHSRDLDDLHRSGRGRRRGSRDWSPKRHRSRSRGSGYHRSRSRGRGTSRSRSRSRGRSYSRSRSRSSRRSRGYRTPSSSSRSPSPPPRRSRSPDRRSRRDSRERSRSRGRRSVSRGRSSRSSSRSVTPPRTLQKQKSVGELRSLSPLSPDPPGTKPDGDVMVFPVKPSEMRPVVLKKTRWNNSYGLKLGTRIFIQDIQPGSLADKNPELKRGDTIMMINGRNVDNKSVQEAIQIIGLSKDKLTMLVKSEDGGTVSIPASQLTPQTAKEKEKPKEKAPVEDNASSLSHRSSPSRASTRSEASRKSDKKHEKKSEPKREPEPEKKPEKKAIGGVRVMPAELSAAVVKEKPKQNYPESTSSRSSSQPSHTPEPAPRAKAVQPTHNQPLYDVPPSDEEEPVLPHDAHTVTFVKGRNVGIRLAGGNDVGIFVASVQEGSPAARQGLKMGDQILSVNDQNFRNIIREEAVLALMGLPDGQEVNIVAQPKPDVYQKILEHGTGDSFYIRTHFKYERANDHEMSFKQGSVFRISDTLYQGMVGYWLAVRIGRSNMEIERGVIPNGSRAQQLKEVQDKKVLQSKEKAQRGGIKRRLKGNQGKGKPEKPATTTTGPQFPAYERVVLREAGFKRPVVIFGPLADIARQRLASDYPPNYEIAGNDGIISGQKSNRKGIIRLNTIKDIIEKDKHAILDITPTAVEKLNYAQLYPIVVFLKPTSKAAVKELRGKLAVTEEEKKKKPGKLYDRAVKMQKGYGHVFTDTIPLGNVSDDWYRKLHSTIKDQQNMPVWVSEDKLGGTAEEDSEGMVVPGDDDRLSYVSAPASDYSVTTVGSEMRHSTTDFDEEDMDDHQDEPSHRSPPTGGVALLPPIKRPPSSTSSSEEDEDAGGRFGDDDLDDALKEDVEEEPPAVKPVPPSSTRDNVRTPPRVASQPAAKADDTSSTSSEEHRPPPTRAPAPVTASPAKPAEPTRGHQSMPEGRFDPDSFLKNHIKRLNKVRSEDSTPPPPRNEPSMSPRHVEPPRHVDPPQPAPQPSVVPKRAPEVESSNRYQPPSQPQSYGPRRDTPNAEPVYAQVDKSRRPPMHGEPQPQPQPQAQPQRPPGGYGDSAYRKPPENTYNRFAGTSSFPPKTNQPPRSNAYKGYTPRPYNKVSGPTGPSRIENGPSKDHMYDSGVDTHEKPKVVQPDHHAPEPLPGDAEDPQVVATARGVFDTDGGVLSSVETGVSIMIPKGAIPPGVRQEIYFKVCKDNTVLPPLDKDKGETLLSPLVMCGPHGLQFNHPVELRLPHCASLTPDGWSFSLKSSDTCFPGEPSQWQNMNMNSDSGYQVSSNSVSVLIDHF